MRQKKLGFFRVGTTPAPATGARRPPQPTTPAPATVVRRPHTQHGPQQRESVLATTADQCGVYQPERIRSWPEIVNREAVGRVRTSLGGTGSNPPLGGGVVSAEYQRRKRSEVCLHSQPPLAPWTEDSNQPAREPAVTNGSPIPPALTPQDLHALRPAQQQPACRYPSGRLTGASAIGGPRVNLSDTRLPVCVVLPSGQDDHPLKESPFKDSDSTCVLSWPKDCASMELCELSTAKSYSSTI
ncbi:hypothetical protein chiPu_0006698 [Chiloscyllium punctatum]|uniref:Uncharacterized protein n=1 Tax=Chiloscyllium punctatum TaxID=137246 RepID=A0A401SCY5_CHIPU|nr:hypothetical protein [Chiloscyllium punctatum]